jgi:iron complex transport system ATP-binding protein
MRFRAEDLLLRYPRAPRPALDRVRLDVPDGTFCALVGPNGSGKSTLLKALLGVLPITGGRVTLDGRDVASWPRRELARAVGVVPQAESVAFPMTVREMVALGRYPHLGPLSAEGARDRDAIAGAMAQCDVAELAERDVTTLSGGEFQRVRIARALAQEPRSLVLDEPTASLDMRHEMTILGLLRAWADGGMTVLVVTHALDLAARFADNVVLLSEGKVAAQGTPAQVVRAEVLESVYRWPVSVNADLETGSPRVTPLDAARRPPRPPPSR